MTPELFMSTLQGTVPSTMELSFGYSDGGIRIIMEPASWSRHLDYMYMNVLFLDDAAVWFLDGSKDTTVPSTSNSLAFYSQPETIEEFLALVPYVEAFQRTAALAKELLYNFPDPESRQALLKHIRGY